MPFLRWQVVRMDCWFPWNCGNCCRSSRGRRRYKVVPERLHEVLRLLRRPVFLPLWLWCQWRKIGDENSCVCLSLVHIRFCCEHRENGIPIIVSIAKIVLNIKVVFNVSNGCILHRSRVRAIRLTCFPRRFQLQGGQTSCRRPHRASV